MLMMSHTFFSALVGVGEMLRIPHPSIGPLRCQGGPAKMLGASPTHNSVYCDVLPLHTTDQWSATGPHRGGAVSSPIEHRCSSIWCPGLNYSCIWEAQTTRVARKGWKQTIGRGFGGLPSSAGTSSQAVNVNTPQASPGKAPDPDDKRIEYI